MTRHQVPNVKVAVHAITWGQDHTKALQEASELGYRAMEPWTSFALQYENRVDELREVFEKYGMTMTAVYGGAAGAPGRKFCDPSRREEIIDYNVRLAKILSDYGAKHIVFGPGAPRERKTSKEELAEAAVTINEAAKRTFDLGVKACVHQHLWTELQDEDELDQLMEMCDPEKVFLAVDTAHMTGAGIDPAAVIRRYPDQVAYVHLKDLTLEDARVEDFSMVSGDEALPVFCELGLGSIAFEPIMKALIDIGYDGWLTVEIDQSTSTPKKSLEICRDFVQNQLGIPIA